MKNKLMALLIILLAGISAGVTVEYSCLEAWDEFSRGPEKAGFMACVKETARSLLLKNESSFNCSVPSMQRNICSGLFVTIMLKGKVRGCYGAFIHNNSSLLSIVKEYIKGALFLDPRHKPLERHELDEAEIIMTVTSNPEPVNDINEVDISDSGVFIECDNSYKIVIVPAEYRTASGILKHAGKPGCRFSRFRAVTLR